LFRDEASASQTRVFSHHRSTRGGEHPLVICRKVAAVLQKMI